MRVGVASTDSIPLMVSRRRGFSRDADDGGRWTTRVAPHNILVSLVVSR